ncbi:MAG: lipopolysaccharide kinase InaA family protein [Nitrospirota bacterium]
MNNLKFFFSHDEYLGESGKFLSLAERYGSVWNPVFGLNRDISSQFESEGYKQFFTSKRTSLFRVSRDNGDFFIRIIHPLTLLDKIKEFFLPSAKTLLSKINRLKEKGFIVPEVVLSAQIKKPLKSIIFYMPVEGNDFYQILSESTETGFKEYFGVSRKKLINCLSREIGRLHAENIFHQDLHLRNIILTPGYRIGLLDLEKVRFSRRKNRKRMIKDLRRLNNRKIPVSDFARLSFLAGYCKALRIDKREEKRKLLSEVLKDAQNASQDK